MPSIYKKVAGFEKRPKLKWLLEHVDHQGDDCLIMDEGRWNFNDDAKRLEAIDRECECREVEAEERTEAAEAEAEAKRWSWVPWTVFWLGFFGVAAACAVTGNYPPWAGR